MIPAVAIEAAAKGMFAEEQCDRRQKLDVESNWRGRLDDRDRDEYLRLSHAALEAAAPHMLAARTEIGYVCRHGHFQFNEDPDGDACGTKIVGRIYVEAEPEISQEGLSEAIGYSLESHHRKMEEWRAK